MDDVKIGSNKSFGIVFFVVFLLIAFYPLVNDADLKMWSLIVSIIFLILGLKKSRLLTPLNQIWFKFGIILGKFVSPIIMSIIFYLLVTPIGLIMKIFQKDLLNLKFNNERSYWLEKKGPKSEMKNQF